MRLIHSVLILVLLSLSLAGCGTTESKTEIQKDRMDPESLKALNNPPPGVPGPPPGSKNKAAPPGTPAAPSAQENK